MLKNEHVGSGIGPDVGELCARLESVFGLYNVAGSEKTPHHTLNSPPEVLPLGVLLPAPVLGRIGALFSSSPLPPPLFATSILSPEFCLKLELLKGLLEFHGSLFAVQRHAMIFSLTYPWIKNVGSGSNAG